MERQHWFKAVLSDWPVMEKNGETILYLNFNPTRLTWKTRDYSLTWLTLALTMGCAAQQQASFEVPHPHLPQMCHFQKYSTSFCPDVNLIYIIPPINEKKSLFILTELPGAQGVRRPSSPFSSSYLSLINTLPQNFILNQSKEARECRNTLKQMQAMTCKSFFQRPAHNAF